jgi:hypothetical protein
MDVTDDAGEDDHPELPPQSDVWLAEQQVVAAAATLRELDATAENPAAQRAALVAYRTAWLRFMVSLCNLPLADRPAAVERVMEALREAHLLRAPGDDDAPAAPERSGRPIGAPPEVSHE